MSNQHLTLRVERAANGPAIRVEGTETTRVARTGEVKSRKDVRHTVTGGTNPALASSSSPRRSRSDSISSYSVVCTCWACGTDASTVIGCSTPSITT